MSVVVFGDDLNGQVRAPEFAQLAADTVFGPCGDNLVLVIDLENRFGAKVHTDAAPLAIVPIPLGRAFPVASGKSDFRQYCILSEAAFCKDVFFRQGHVYGRSLDPVFETVSGIY